MSDLPKVMRESLADFVIFPPVSIETVQDATDGTQKLLLGLAGGHRAETVLIPMGRTEVEAEGDSDDDDEDSEVDQGTSITSKLTITQCVSSQVGCAMACGFCASGLAGLKRHLTAAEIIAQVHLGRFDFGSERPLRNVVFMGMGEPLHNYDATARALRVLTHPNGLAFSKRRVTVSTSGLIPEIERLGADFDGQIQLAISLHAPTDEQRTQIMPINKKYPLTDLVAALRRYPMPKRRSITVEYTLIKGFNDAPSDAQRLHQLLRGLRYKVNLIPWNAVADTPLKAPSWDEVERFQRSLQERSIITLVRRRKGDDIAAACGQLALNAPTKVRRMLPKFGD